MKTYAINLKEVKSLTVGVEAESLEEAIEKANGLYQKGTIDMDGEFEFDGDNTKEDEFFKDHIDWLDEVYDSNGTTVDADER